MKHTGGVEPARTKVAKSRRLFIVGRQYKTRRILPSDGAGNKLRLERFYLAGNEKDRSPLAEPEGLFTGHGERRDVVQRCLNRHKAFQSGAPMHQIREIFQRNRLWG